jgi:uncharacterized protein
MTTTALHRAAGEGDLDKVTRLLQSGIDPNVCDPIQQPALFKILRSSWSGNDAEHMARIATFRVLWDVTDPEIRSGQDQEGNTVLHLMAQHGFDELIGETLSHVPTLVQKRTYVTSESPIHTVILNSCLDSEKAFLMGEHFFACDVNVANDKDLKDQNILHYAARYGSLKILELCYHAYDGDIDATDQAGMTPLAIAKNENNLEAYSYLMSQGADETLINLSTQTVSSFRR